MRSQSLSMLAQFFKDNQMRNVSSSVKKFLKLAPKDQMKMAK